jgi:WD40 repeat protein/tRNA A-37 threonylcarbamoyl transferase component Bud32
MGTAVNPSQFHRIDQVCDDFEAQWVAGKRPLVEDYLARAAPGDQAALEAELLRVEREFRQKAGETLPPQGNGGGADPHETEPVSQEVAGAPVVPGYEILCELGRGGMGVVYKARQVALRRLVALKMIRSEQLPGAEERERFQAEAEAVARLSHPHVVQVFEVGAHEGRPYFSLELCEGGNLAQRLKTSPLTASDAAALVRALAEAAAHAHARGVIHRDVKPANVLLTSDGTWKLTDFGLAKRLDAGANTRTGAFLGTPAYAAPEQARGQNKEVGPAADVYALGVILYECLVGRPPFNDPDPLETLLQVIEAEPVAPRTLQPKVPRDLETICLKCLRKEPQQRYADAGELADDLGRFLKGEPIRARPIGALSRLAKRARRRPAVTLLVLALCAVTLTGVAAVILQAGQASRDRVAAQERLNLARADLVTAQLLRVGVIYEKDPVAAEFLLFDEAVIPPQDRDFAWGFYRNYCRRASRQVLIERGQKGPQINRQGIAYSPDGKEVAVCTRNDVRIIDVSSGQTRRVVPLGLSKPWHQHAEMKFDPSGRYLALVGCPEGFSIDSVLLCDLNVGRVSRTWQLDQQQAVLSLGFTDGGETLVTQVDPKSLVRWSVPTGAAQLVPLPEAGAACFVPDGSLLIVATERGPIRLLDARTGEVRATLLANDHVAESLAISPDGRWLATAGRDEVCVWDVLAQKVRSRLQTQNAPTGLAISTGGETVVRYERLHGRSGWVAPGRVPGRLLAARRRADVPSATRWDVASKSITGTVSADDPSAVSPDCQEVAQVLSGENLAVVELRRFAVAAEILAVRPIDRKVAEEVEYLLKVDRSDRLVAYPTKDGKAHCWDVLARKEVLRSWAVPKEWLLSAVNPEARLAVLVRAEEEATPSKRICYSLKVRDLATGTDRLDVSGPRYEKGVGRYGMELWGEPDVASLSRDGALFGYVNEEDRIVCHDLDQGQLGSFGVKGEKVIALCFTPNRKKLVSLGYGPPLPDDVLLSDAIDHQGTPPPVNLRIWDVGGRNRLGGSLQLQTLPASIDFSADGKLLALGGLGEAGLSVWLVDVDRWRVLHSFRMPFSRFNGVDEPWFCPKVRFTADRKWLYAVNTGLHLGQGATAGVVVWDVDKRREQAHFSMDRLISWTVLPGSLTFASGDADGTLKLWDMRTGQERLSIQAHKRQIVHLAFSADGKTLTSVDWSGQLKVWDGDAAAP